MGLAFVSHSSSVPLPSSIGGYTFPVPVPLLLPLAPTICLLLGLERGAKAGQGVAVRRISWMNSVLVVCGVAAGYTFGLVQYASYDDPSGLGLARNLAGYAGLALVMRWAFGARVAPIVTVSFPFLCTFLGLDATGTPQPWAWPIDSATSTSAAVLALALLGTGVALSHRDQPSRLVAGDAHQ
ncbi:hypothetical protein AB0C96_24260 [Streptomyces sp. NPDC048506]|uniref:hypothetical protein n=1 Tax=Streptomyces sp. NPDC048506 TaxID=3155028 RepID=UPI00342FDD1F